tara:strand:- start:831 stop:1562 length:732 start_codon:yes stop_codon:yes gene_type:complete
MGGALFTTSDGEAIKNLPSGDLILDFLHGTVTDSAGNTTTMNTNLDYYNLSQCSSFAVYASDSDTAINVGNALTIADHQLTHVVNNYDFDDVRLTIPDNSIPANSNQIMFVGSTDAYLGYIFNNYAHFRDQLTTPPVADTASTNNFVTYVSHHVGGYDQILYTVENTGGANSINVKVQFSENGIDWFDDIGYTGATGVTVAFGSYNAYASSVYHHFRRVQVQSTVAGSPSTFNIFWNYVSANN